MCCSDPLMSPITNTRVRRDLQLPDCACLLPDRLASCGLLEGCGPAPTAPLEVGIPAATPTPLLRARRMEVGIPAATPTPLIRKKTEPTYRLSFKRRAKRAEARPLVDRHRSALLSLRPQGLLLGVE